MVCCNIAIDEAVLETILVESVFVEFPDIPSAKSHAHLRVVTAAYTYIPASNSCFIQQLMLHEALKASVAVRGLALIRFATALPQNTYTRAKPCSLTRAVAQQVRCFRRHHTLKQK
jgi:hypothetical protein